MLEIMKRLINIENSSKPEYQIPLEPGVKLTSAVDFPPPGTGMGSTRHIAMAQGFQIYRRV
jgi:hypothetical protein